ncbi:MAG: serine kinase [Pseudomonadota bacterium]
MSGLSEIRHATAVSVEGSGVLITGVSGRGKSALALQLMALGADLVADDQVCVQLDRDALILSRPDGLPAKIEARGIGLLDTSLAETARLDLLIDLDQQETARLPEPQVQVIFGVPVTFWRNVDAPHFPAAILLYLRAKRVAS